MKHIKTYEGLFDFMKKSRQSDERLIAPYLDILYNDEFNLNITKIVDDPFDIGEEGLQTDKVFKIFTLDNLKCSQQYKSKEIKIYINGRELNLSNKKKEELYDIIMNVYAYTESFIKVMAPMIGLSINECRERLIEFDVIRNGKIDEISLSSLFDYCEVPLTPNHISKLNKQLAHEKNELDISNILDISSKNML